jgi:hypothetical protein
MRTLQFLSATFIAMLLVNMVQAENADSVKVQKRIVKTVQITEDGKTITDTTFVFEGDGREFSFGGHCENFPGPGMMMHRRMNKPGGRGMAWSSDEDIDIVMDGDSVNVMVFRSPGRHAKAFNFEHQSDGPGMHWQGEDFGPRMERLQVHRQANRNLIDLNDPAVISFEKETLKNGDEKITIIRKAEK